MANDQQLSPGGLDEDAALRTILEGTAAETGERFFAALVQALARALGTHGAWVTEYLEEARRLRALAFWCDGQWVADFEYDIAGTPCEPVVAASRIIHLPDRAIELYPDDPDLHRLGAVSYLGAPLLDVDGRVLGHLAVLDQRPMPEEPRAQAIFHIFAARAAAELQRLRAEADLIAREQQLDRLVNGAMDAIVELDAGFRVAALNVAAARVFGAPADALIGNGFARLLDDDSAARVTRLAAELAREASGRQSGWIRGGLTGRRASGEQFPAEATLSRGELRGQPFYTVVLRDVRDRLEAERRIASLAGEAECLRDEIRALHHGGRILGDGPALRRVLDEVAQVGDTDATVLILGETGTGKELIARAVHGSSRRRAEPLVKVNCAALPAALIESELFGHESGAFTGATKRRDGRFALADRGSIFLDEIGELPLELQAKLLRVLQEGEFEPLGSSQTRRVDVRVIAATNRDLERAVARGAFREDLFYRLHVFPIRIPPLRDRREDIPALAAAFAERCAQKLGRRIEPLTSRCVARLQAYAWPGNVRELENVIERAVITAQSGRLDVGGTLPEESAAAAPPPPGAAAPVYTAGELRDLERENLRRALERSGWQVAGDHGAAKLLGMRPSTLASRIKALGIRRPT